MHYRGKRREGEDMEAVVERHPNTADSSPQSTLIQAGRASGVAGSSEVAEMATFCGCPFGLGVGTAVRGFREKEVGPVLRGTAASFGGSSVGPRQALNYPHRSVREDSRGRTVALGPLLLAADLQVL